MVARSLPGADVHGGPQPLARWRLWAQVSNNGLVEFMGDRGPRPVVLATDPYGHVILPLGARDASAAADEAVMAEGALPLAARADTSASVVPVSTAATLWSDGDTMLDIRPEQWRPLTITLAPPPMMAPPHPRSPPAALHPLRVAAARAGWMLAGVALTFIGGAAALGGGPLIQVVRSTLGHASAPLVAASAAPAPVVAAPPPHLAAPVVAAPPLVAAAPPAAVAAPVIPAPITAPTPQVAPAPAAPSISKAPAGSEPIATRRMARSDGQPQRTLAEPTANRFDTHRPIDLEDPFGAP